MRYLRFELSSSDDEEDDEEESTSFTDSSALFFFDGPPDAEPEGVSDALRFVDLDPKDAPFVFKFCAIAYKCASTPLKPVNRDFHAGMVFLFGWPIVS